MNNRGYHRTVREVGRDVNRKNALPKLDTAEECRD